jgi:hypothetical protein
MEKLITFKNLDDLTKYFKSELRCVSYFDQFAGMVKGLALIVEVQEPTLYRV